MATWNGGPDLNVPMQALNMGVRQIIRMHMDIPGLMLKKSGITNDWTGLAELLGFQFLDIQNFALKESSTMALLNAYTVKQGNSVAQLIQKLEELERRDVLGEIMDAVYMNVKSFLDSKNSIPSQVQVPEVSTSRHDPFITVDDANTGYVQPYHAFISHCSEDDEFVHKLISEVEEAHGLRLCIPERDLLGGTCKYVVTAELIEKRCWRTIIVLSPDYLESPECDFEIKFAQALSPGSKDKKIIPVMISRCPIPPILRFITVLDYTRGTTKTEPRWFWNRLAASLRVHPDWDESENAYNRMDSSIKYPVRSSASSAMSTSHQPVSASSIQLEDSSSSVTTQAASVPASSSAVPAHNGSSSSSSSTTSGSSASSRTTQKLTESGSTC